MCIQLPDELVEELASECAAQREMLLDDPRAPGP